MIKRLVKQTIMIILGSLLGNGTLKIHFGYVNAQFSFRHNIIQSDYFYWKLSQLSEISNEKSVFKKKSNNFSKFSKLWFISQELLSLTYLYQLTHDGGRFRIKRKWLNQMDNLSLAIWWFENGSLVTNTHKGVICTDKFDELSIKLLVRYLKIKWNIKTVIKTIQKSSNLNIKYFRIWIRSINELKKLLRLVALHVPKCMLYKVIILYKDSELQQRWISELNILTKFSIEEISEVVNKRKELFKYN